MVFKAGGSEALDTPLPLALSHIVGENSWLMHLLVSVGIFGLVASFHGIILAAGRATFEFGRVGYAPKILGTTHKKFKTPAMALLLNMLVGIVALLSGKTGDIITIACFGALSLYIISMVSFFKLRWDHPDMVRPFKFPLYPLFPATALIIASVSLVAMTFYNQILALIFFGIMAVTFIAFKIFIKVES